MIAILMALIAAAAPPAHAAEKAQIMVMNERNEPIVMKFDYAFRQYTYQLMKQDIPADGDITYRFPIGLPGCEKLHEWGIADGLLTISNAAGALCTKRVSLCDASAVVMHVQRRQCTWSGSETSPISQEGSDEPQQPNGSPAQQ